MPAANQFGKEQLHLRQKAGVSSVPVHALQPVPDRMLHWAPLAPRLSSHNPSRMQTGPWNALRACPIPSWASHPVLGIPSCAGCHIPCWVSHPVLAVPSQTGFPIPCWSALPGCCAGTCTRLAGPRKANALLLLWGPFSNSSLCCANLPPGTHCWACRHLSRSHRDNQSSL